MYISVKCGKSFTGWQYKHATMLYTYIGLPSRCLALLLFLNIETQIQIRAYSANTKLQHFSWDIPHEWQSNCQWFTKNLLGNWKWVTSHYPFHPILLNKVGAMWTLQIICILEFVTSSKAFSNGLNFESTWGQRHIIFIVLSSCLWGTILELGPDSVRARIVTYCIPPPRILPNICCAGIGSSSTDPEKRVVLGHRCHSSISRKYLRPRVRGWGARRCFIIWWERPLNGYVSVQCSCAFCFQM